VESKVNVNRNRTFQFILVIGFLILVAVATTSFSSVTAADQCVRKNLKNAEVTIPDLLKKAVDVPGSDRKIGVSRLRTENGVTIATFHIVEYLGSTGWTITEFIQRDSEGLYSYPKLEVGTDQILFGKNRRKERPYINGNL
jgi:hypothetical protein